MSYKIIQPPFTLEFRKMSEKELKDYFQWFMASIPERIHELASAVRETPGFEHWQPDNTPDSLNALGEWFSTQVETRPRTPEEIEKINAQSSHPYPPLSGEELKELTNRTFSLAMDIGMYVSQVFLHNHPSLRWEQDFKYKRSNNYGQPVLRGFGPMAFNPVWMTVVVAYCFADKSKTGERLREVYNIWSKKVLV